MNLRVFYLTRRGLSDGYLALFSCRWALKADIVALLSRSLFFFSNAGGCTIERGTGHD